MHTDQTKEKFIELKVLGIPVEDIMQTLAISRATAFRWQHEHQHDIARRRLLHFETIQARLLGRYEDRLTTALTRLQRYQSEMDQRQTKYMTMEELQMLILDARKELDKLTFTPAFLESQCSPAVSEPQSDAPSSSTDARQP
jgi:hypothetical protein